MSTNTNFTIEQIKEAHSKVKSGADFPAYIQELKQLGVMYYTTYVSDGHTDYTGNHHAAHAPAKYAPLTIDDKIDAETFKADLKAHQQGKTDYPTFCSDCAKSGVAMWTVSLGAMTCIYYDVAGHVVLAEQIPE